MGSVKFKDLKAYVRYDGSGRVVAGSLVFRKKKPKNGRWSEISSNLCCNPGGNTTTTTTTSGGGVTPTAFIKTFWENVNDACTTIPAGTYLFYSASTELVSGSTIFEDAALTIPITAGWVILAGPGNTIKYLVGAGGVLSVLDCQDYACPTLGDAGRFSVLGASTVTNTGYSYITSDLGIYPGSSVTGFPPGYVDGTQHIADGAANNAHFDANNAWQALYSLSSTGSLPADISGYTITPGIYSVASSLESAALLTLDGQGDSNAVFVFKIPSTLSINGTVSITGGAKAGNIYWVVGSSATIGVGSQMYGNIIAQASITMNTSAGLQGRAIALNGAVTLDNNNVNGRDNSCTVNPIA